MQRGNWAVTGEGDVMSLNFEKAVCVLVLLVFFVVSCTDKEIVTPSTVFSSSTASPSNRTPVPTVVEPGLAYGVPCKPPCWHGLIPGQSTTQEVEQAMDELRASEWASLVEGSPVWGYHIYPLPHTPDGSIHIVMDDTGTVAKIGGTTLFHHPMGTLVEQFGKPERLYLISRRATVCLSCEDWKPSEPMPSVPVHLLYPSQGLWFLALVPDSGLGCICPEMGVIAFCYHAPITMQEALTDNYLAGLCSSSLEGVTQDDLVEWHGFGGGY
jgi:hypothetical protein